MRRKNNRIVNKREKPGRYGHSFWVTEQEAATGRANMPWSPSRGPSHRPNLHRPNDVLSAPLFLLSSPSPHWPPIPFIICSSSRRFPPTYALSLRISFPFLLGLSKHFTATLCSPNRYFAVGLSSPFLLLTVSYFSLFLSPVLSLPHTSWVPIFVIVFSSLFLFRCRLFRLFYFCSVLCILVVTSVLYFCVTSSFVSQQRLHPFP